MYVSADSSNSKRGESTQLRGFGGEGEGNKQGKSGRGCVVCLKPSTEQTNTDVLYYSKRRMKRTLERLHGTV